MARDEVWFPRMGDIPGLEYTCPLDIDRTTLPGYDRVPTVDKWEWDGKTRTMLNWADPHDSEEYSTSQSPASSHGSDRQLHELAPSTRLRQTLETLELPGHPSDYHFPIQTCAQVLARHKRFDPGILTWVEWLHLLDIRLVQAYPQTVYYDDEYRKGYYSVSAFSGLASMREQEGQLAEAIATWKTALEFEQPNAQERIDELTERLDNVRGEDAS